jgi:hypothetical protein
MSIRDWRWEHQTVFVLIWLTQLPGATARAADTPELIGGAFGAAAVAFAVVAGGRVVARRLRGGAATTSNG